MEDTENAYVSVPKRGSHELGEVSRKDSCLSTRGLDLMYSIRDTPPWYISIFLAFQQYLTLFGSIIITPLILSSPMCITDAVNTADIISTSSFVYGIITAIQVLIGVRLPIIQGSSATFMITAIVILSLPQWQCPATEQVVNVSAFNLTNNTMQSNQIWLSRMRELQGGIIVASLFQIVIGFSGVIGFLVQYIGPLVIAATITLLGLSLCQVTAAFCSTNWAISIMTIVMLILFSQYLRNYNFPCCSYERNKGCVHTRYPVFKLFPIILAIFTSWGICSILTVTNIFPDNAAHWTYGARTDTKLKVLEDAQWFRIPYPGQWGLPTCSTASVMGMLASVFIGIIESIGDYYMCARLSGASPPPLHAINRGIFIEGIGCMIAGIFGTTGGPASYSENIASISITKVGSRTVIIYTSCIMILLGLMGKFGALFVTIPGPILGATFMIIFGMIAAVGISNLQFVNMNSSRNLLIFGFSLFFGLTVPEWIKQNEHTVIYTGNSTLDQIITVLLSTNMVVGGAIALLLDNTVPGTEAERGIGLWKLQANNSNGDLEGKTYNLPCGMSVIKSTTWTKYLPLCPTFTGCTRQEKQYVKTETYNNC